jgi:hypothetical protein
MQFYEISTVYNLFRKEYGYKDPMTFYNDVIRDYRDVQRGSSPKFGFQSHIQLIFIVMEKCWYNLRMPYYKIWPGVFDSFIKTRLDIKANLLRFPHEIFTIKLPKTDDGILTFDFNGAKATVESIMVLSGDGETIRSQGCTGISFRVIYNVDKPNYEYQGCFMNTVKMQLDKTIEESMSREECFDTTSEGENYLIPKFIIDACARLTVATIFLATGSHKVLEFDVLSKHLSVYRAIRDTNAAARKDYENKAKQKGKFGWNIGSGRGDRSLKLPNGTTYAKACKDAGGRELLYQHVRGGHWHTVRYGEGRKEIKIVWFEDTVVRKDLLPKPLDV